MAKKAKAAAQYGPGHPDAHCGICRHFEKPDACEIVAGVIKPSMWCKFFARRRTRAQRLYDKAGT